MTDKTKRGGGSKGAGLLLAAPARGETGGRPPRAGGGRPFHARGEAADRPQRPRPEGGERPFRKRSEGDERPARTREAGERPFRARSDSTSDRPQRSRPDGGDRPFRKRPEGEAGERPYRKRTEGGERPARTREAGERPFRARSDSASDRPQRSRPDGGDRPFRKRPEGDAGEKPYRARSGGGGDRPFRARSDSGDRPFRPRQAGADGARPPREGGDRPYGKRAGGSDRPPRPRAEGGERRERAWSPEGERPQRRRPEGGDRPFRSRNEGGPAPARAGTTATAPSGPAGTTVTAPAAGARIAGRSAPRIAGGAPRKADYAERIAKVIARAGLCSRRDAEAWVEAGRVSVNGEVLTSPARDVTKSDTVMVDGTPLPTRERTRLFLYHKPRGIVTTARDPEGRATVFESLPPGLPRVVTVGRLDINTEGLLLLTNDGGLSRVLELPETGWLRRYRVRAFGAIDQSALDALKDGVTIDGMHYGPVEAEIDREKGDNVWLIIGLREGKNREVKRILEHLGMTVNRLIRISFGPFQLGDLPEGAAEEVTTRVLADQLGPDLAARAEADFESPCSSMTRTISAPRSASRASASETSSTGASGSAGTTATSVPGVGVSTRTAVAAAFGATKPRRRSAPVPARRHPTEVVRNTWRADEEERAPAPKRIPRRGADPKAARAESGEREHVRAGRVKSRAGREVLVEKVARAPGASPRDERSDEEESAPRRRNAWSEGGERPARAARAPRPSGSGEGRPQRSFGDRAEAFPA